MDYRNSPKRNSPHLPSIRKGKRNSRRFDLEIFEILIEQVEQGLTILLFTQEYD